MSRNRVGTCEKWKVTQIAVDNYQECEEFKVHGEVCESQGREQLILSYRIP